MHTGKFGTLHPMMPVGDDLADELDEDLAAICAYLRTLKPVSHVVSNGVEPTDCPVCGLKHGGGDRNGT